MNNQKIENLLNLALDATEEEREKSEALRVGYDREEKTWELIVKYNGDLGEITTLLPQIKVVELSNEYAILTVPESQIEALTGFSQIEYIEKPKRLYFSVNVGKSVSCINPVQGENKALSGKGIIVAIIDSGIDYFHKDFRNADGSTRILQLWDQDKDQVYSEEQINAALKSGSRDAAYQLVPSRDLSGHGTAVAGIAVGNGLANGGIY
ncbi:MAG: S8 family serine peptidase, partial [Clostridium sp.]